MARAQGPRIPISGLVLYLDAANIKSYPGTGTTWTDISGTGNNGTLQNGVTYSTDNNGIFVFDGVDDNVDCGNNSTINFGTGDFTVSVWFNRAASATSNLRLLSKAADNDTGDANHAGFCFYGSNTGINFAINPTAARTILSAATYSLGEWVNVVGLIERGVSTRTYKNATLTDTDTAPAGSVSGNVSLYIGDNMGTNLRWVGDIALVQLYNRALSAQEITQNFNALRGRFGI